MGKYVGFLIALSLVGVIFLVSIRWCIRKVQPIAGSRIGEILLGSDLRLTRWISGLLWIIKLIGVLIVSIIAIKLLLVLFYESSTTS